MENFIFCAVSKPAASQITLAALIHKVLETEIQFQN